MFLPLLYHKLGGLSRGFAKKSDVTYHLCYTHRKVGIFMPFYNFIGWRESALWRRLAALGGLDACTDFVALFDDDTRRERRWSL